MHLISHLNFDGQCEAAFQYYKECLGGSIPVMLTYGSQPLTQSAPELKDKIFHATLQIGDQKLTGVDVEHSAYLKPQGFSVQLNLDDSAEAKRIFNILSESGSVLVPLQQTSWAGHYAALRDRFGIPWEINCSS